MRATRAFSTLTLARLFHLHAEYGDCFLNAILIYRHAASSPSAAVKCRPPSADGRGLYAISAKWRADIDDIYMMRKYQKSRRRSRDRGA